MKTSTLMLVLVGVSAALAISGCATKEELEAVSNKCMVSAAVAQGTADQALECCEKNREATDRLFQKMMKK